MSNLIVIDRTPDGGTRLQKGRFFLNIARANFPGAIQAGSVHEMVQRVLAATGSNPINRLRIYGHGLVEHRQGGIQGMGTGHDFSHATACQLISVNAAGRLNHAFTLSLLRGHFASNAVVELRGCQVALGHNGRQLLRELTNLWGVRVQAGAENQVNRVGDTIDRFEGPVSEAYPVHGHGARIRPAR